MSTMPSLEKLSSSFAQLKPGDGYSVTLVDENDSIGLYFNLRLGEKYVKMIGMDNDATVTIKLATWEEPNEYARGEAARLYLVTDAIARFFNTGGEWELLGIVFSALQKNGVGTADFSPYRLIRSFLTIDDNETLDGEPNSTYAYQHVYADSEKPLKNETPVIVVHESAGSSVCTYGEIKDDEG